MYAETEMAAFQIFVTQEPTIRLITHSKIRRKKLHGNLHTYLKLFKMFGIDIGNSWNIQLKTTASSIRRNLMKLYWVSLTLTMLSSTYIACSTYVTSSTYGENLKNLLDTVIMTLTSFLMWRHTAKFQRKINKIIEKLQNLQFTLEILPPQKFITFSYSFFIILCFLSIILYAYPYDQEKSKFIFSVITFDSRYTDWRVTLLTWHVYYFEMHYQYFFTCALALFYIIVCRYMMLILSRHVDINKTILKMRFISAADCDICFIRYEAIISTFDTINSLLSFPIFLESCYSACGVLWGLLMILMHQEDEIAAKDFLFSFTNFVLFTAISFASSAVNEIDKMAKKTNLKILRSLNKAERNKTKEGVEILSQTCHAPAFTLTGWNVFEYTKGFYLTALGCLTTYTLLVIDL